MINENSSGLQKNIVQNRDGAVRLNKYLSDSGVCSRRQADRMIEAGRVQINERTAVLGEKAKPGDRIFVDGKEVQPDDQLILLALHKPAGIECTTDRSNPDNIIDFLNYPVRVYPIGRLDKNSTGLILLTNTGELVNRILKSSNYHEKEYIVSVDHAITPLFLEQMRKGVKICIDNEDRIVTTRECKAEKIDDKTFSIVLTQGYNRQIRRMCRALGYKVMTLKRIRIMNILLGDLPEGKCREVREKEIRELVRQSD